MKMNRKYIRREAFQDNYPYQEDPFFLLAQAPF